MPTGRLAWAAAVVTLGSIACACSTLAATQDTPAPVAPGPSVETSPGKALFETACSECHELAFATQMRNSRAGWAQVVDRMSSNGMGASPDQKNQIIDYLAAVYGPQ